MKGQIKYISTKAIIILITAFMCLPFSIKREIKQTLNIPISHLEHSENPNKTIACQIFSKEEKQNIFLSYQKKDIQKHHYKFYFTFQQTDVLQYNISPFPGIKFFAPVPIYILHEQYLI